LSFLFFFRTGNYYQILTLQSFNNSSVI
jgi:hypothetical protein